MPTTEIERAPGQARAASADNGLMIDIHDLVKRYQHHIAVDGIDLEVRTGEIFGILGPNGAGKTTTLEMIEGLRQPDSGTITVAGFDAVKESEKVRRVIGVQLQTTALFPYLTSGELIELFGSFYQLPDPAKRVDELLTLVDLQAKAKSRVDEMSGGQQQRLSIALALVNQPLVTFLDEPTTGLDPHARRSLWKAIQGVRDSGTTVVLTTHYMEEAEVLCNRVAIMDSGRIIACDTPANLTRGLDMEATVQATVEQGTMSDVQLRAIPGVTAVDHTSEMPPRLALQTSDVQATITALLDIARRDGVTLNDLTSSRATLEDVFLTLTGRKYEQQNGEGTEEEAPPKKKRRRFL